MKKIDTAYFPGWTRKSLTFTIDDGNVGMDAKFLSIVKPAGILGTFNLCSHWMDKMSPEEYREFYRGYEIANHCKYHPQVFSDTMRYVVSEEPFDKLTSESYTSANPIVYKTGVENLFVLHGNPKREKPLGWSNYTTAEHYIRFIKEGHRELEEIFGEGSVTGFVWPYSRQGSAEVLKYLADSDYYGVRKTGALLDSTGFDMPADRLEWTYNATHSTLLSLMEKYEEYPDDGRLKFFSLGVHSVDFETAGKWDDLKAFAERYGNRPEDYYYATVRDIFTYEDAVLALEITDSEIKNPSDIDLYVKIDGDRTVLRAKSSVKL